MRLKIALFIGTLFLVLIGGYYAYLKKHPVEGYAPGTVAGILRKGNEAFDNYVGYVKILHPKAELAVNFKGDRIAIISGALVNQGEKPLEAVELTISLYDNKGSLVKQETRTPLRPDTGLRQPLRPLEKTNFTIWVESIPSNWDPNRGDIELTGLKFIS